MPHLLSKLTSCVHRAHHSKSMKISTIPDRRYFFKLSRFELMPDEILVEIFQYIPLVDLYNGFVHLNFRLNYLLRQLRLGVSIDENEQKNNSLLAALDYFCKQMQYIHVDRYSHLNLNIFPNLRSLTIYLPTNTQLLAINRTRMPRLRRLWLGILSQKYQAILCETLFGREQFKELHFCNLFELNFNETLNSFQSSLHLRRVILTNCQTKDFILLLSFLPNLNELDICISDVLCSSSHNLTNFSHRNLRVLKIEFAQNLAQLNILNCLVSFVPHVQQCTLFLVNLIQMRDYAHLQKILNEKFVQLRQLICSIDYYCQVSSNEMKNKCQRLRTKLPFFQTMTVVPCHIHREQCVRKTWMNKTFA